MLWSGRPARSGGANRGCPLPDLRALAPILLILAFAAAPARAEPGPEPFPALPLPPAIGGLTLPETYRGGRREHLDLVTRTALEAGLPPEVADAVAHVESRYDPGAVGGVGEIGLMQVRPQTAAMLGHAGGMTALFVPEVNVKYGVMYLARAWQLAEGDLCRALMKYRAGWGEQTMSPLSVEYCRRARQHLAAIGSPLAAGELPPPSSAPASPPPRPAEALSLAGGPWPRTALALPPRRPVLQPAPPLPASRPAKVQTAALAAPAIRPAENRKAVLKRRMWAAHEVRMNQITRRLSSAQLRIASGI